MRYVLAVMVTFGMLVGLAFPAAVDPLVDWRPGGLLRFRAACVLAGLLVGGFAYGVARFTLYRTNQRLAVLAAIDPLTGLANQRYFVEVLAVELQRAGRLGGEVSLLIADLDRFKRINDTRGHLVGNAVLALVAHTIRGSVRPYDVPCRIGGEEFAVILPGASRDDAAGVAERLREAVRRESRQDLPLVTVSVGCATYPQDAGDAMLLVKRADDALYEAKRTGRDRVRDWRQARLGATKPEKVAAEV